MPDITINGRLITADDGMTVLDAALKHNIDIPHICHHPMLEKYGGCRMCMVSVEGSPRLVSSCTLKPEVGMVIETESTEIIKARKAVLEFLLINHPLECPSCDKAGACKLQDYAFRYGAASGRFEEKKIVKTRNLNDPLIKKNMGRCIMCTRCVRMCAGVQGANALAPLGRGNKSIIGPFAGDKFDCEYCGNCISICPVGALTSRKSKYGARAWNMDKTASSACPHCGMACQVKVESRMQSIQKVSPLDADSLSEGILCARGNFAHDFLQSPARLSTPLVRENGHLKEATWDEALKRISEGLLQIKKDHGGDSIAGIASANCTNEDNYMFQKFIRSALGSSNVDSSARMGLAGSRPFVENLLGPNATAFSVSEVSSSDAIIVLGGDPLFEMPLLGVKIRNAFNNGATIINFGDAKGLEKHCTFNFKTPQENQWPAVEALLGQLLKDKRQRDGNLVMENLLYKLELPEPEEIPYIHHAEDISCAAQTLENNEDITIVVGRGAAMHEHGARNLLVISALAYALNARLVLSSEKPNENGALDMGCSPERLPGGYSINDETARKKFEAGWGCNIPIQQGMTLMEMFEAAKDGKLKALYIMGYDPAESLPGSGFVQEALESLDMLVVQDIFLSETARMADVVLPAASWGEKNGTYTNVQQQTVSIEKAIENINRPDWQILADLSTLCNVKANYKTAKEVMAEAERLSADAKSIKSDNSRKGPEIALEGRGMPDITELFSMPPMPEQSKYHLELERSYFSTGSLSRNSISMMDICHAPALNINPETAKGLGLKDGDKATVSTDQGLVVLPVKIIPSFTDGTCMISSSSIMHGIMGLFKSKVSRFTSTPYASYSGLKISKSSTLNALDNTLAFK
jgi:NADH-quinone oxidoreductase chain G